MKIKIKKLHPLANLPQRSDEGCGGWIWENDPNFKENLILNIESKIIKYNASKI